MSLANYWHQRTDLHRLSTDNSTMISGMCPAQLVTGRGLQNLKRSEKQEVRKS